MSVLDILLLIAGASAAPQAPAPATGSAVQAPATVEKAADSRDKMICQRFVETGSLVRGVRVCKTKAEWEQERDNIRREPGIDSCRNRASGGPC